MRVGILAKDFTQPVVGGVAIAEIEPMADTYRLTLGGFVELGSSGCYCIARIDCNHRRNVVVTLVRLFTQSSGEVRPGGKIYKGEVVRILTDEGVDFLAGHRSSVPPYIHNQIPGFSAGSRTGLHSTDDFVYWREECDRLVGQLIQRVPGIHSEDATGGLIDLAIREYGLSHFELAQSLRHSSPYIDIQTVERQEALVMRGKIAFRGSPYRMSSIDARIRSRLEARIDTLRHGPDMEALRDILLRYQGYAPSASDVAQGLGASTGFVRKSEIPDGCKGCANLHGQAYTGEHGRNMFICAMHPSGYEGEGECPDRQ